MFAMLGNIRFDIIRNSVTSFNHNKSVRFAVHDVFKSKQRTQKIAQNLDDISLTVGLHRKSGNVQGRIDALDALMNDQKPVSFMMGDGRMVGNFVVESINITMKVVDDVGGVIEADVYLYLREFVGEMDDQGGLSGLAGSAMGAIGSITTSINNALGMVQDIFDGINDLVDAGRSLLSIAYNVRDMINSLSGANDGMQILRDLSPLLAEGMTAGRSIQNSADGWDEQEVAQYGDFLNAAIAMLESFELANGIVEESIATNEVLKLNELEVISVNMASQAQTLNIENMNVLCDIGLREF